MSNYIELIFLFLFVLLCYSLSKKIGKEYRLIFFDNGFSIERKLVIQTIYVADIKKVTIRKNSIFFRGSFLVKRGNGKDWKVPTIELTNNNNNDLEVVKAFLLKNGF